MPDYFLIDDTTVLEVRALAIMYDGYPVIDFTMTAGDIIELDIRIEPLGALTKVVDGIEYWVDLPTWIINDASIVSLGGNPGNAVIAHDKMTLEALAPGTTTLIVSVGEIFIECVIRVEDPATDYAETANNAITYELPSNTIFFIGLFTEDWQRPFYYVPDDDVIDLLASYILEAMTGRVERGSYEIIGSGIPMGYHIMHNAILWEVISSGQLVTWDPLSAEYVIIHSAEAVELSVELMRYIGIPPFSPDMIRDIISLEIEKRNTGIDGFYDETITDRAKLAEIEAILTSAEYYASGCPFNDVFVTLTLASGDEILLGMSSDSCSSFFINGQAFSFKVPGNDGYWYSFFTDHLRVAADSDN